MVELTDGCRNCTVLDHTEAACTCACRDLYDAHSMVCASMTQSVDEFDQSLLGCLDASLTLVFCPCIISLQESKPSEAGLVLATEYSMLMASTTRAVASILLAVTLPMALAVLRVFVSGEPGDFEAAGMAWQGCGSVDLDARQG
jgi:hypothetical protein